MRTLKPFIVFNLFLKQSIDLTDGGVLYRIWYVARNIDLSVINRVEHRRSFVFDNIILSAGNKKISIRFLNKKDAVDFISGFAAAMKIFYLKRLQEYGLDGLVRDFKALLRGDKYIAEYDIRLLINQYDKLADYCNSLLTDACFNLFKDTDLSEKVNNVIELTHYKEKIKAIVKKRNEKFIKDEMVRYAYFFKSFGGYPYSEEQQKAIITFEDRNLLVAAAGSGKTSTLIGKIGYAVEKNLFEPDEILLLVFNSSVRQEIKEKIEKLKSIRTVEKNVHTFHSFGRKYLGRVVVEEQTDSAIARIVENLRFKKKSFASDYINFVTVYAKDVIDKYSGKDYEVYINETKRDRKIFKEKVYFKTIKGDFVKSYEELSIANFLFINGINYIYENEYPFVVTGEDGGITSYRPDFYYPDIDAYHEHFAVNGNGKSIFGDKYIGDIKLKRDTHKKNHTVLVETTSAMFKSGTLFPYLQNILREKGIVLRPKSLSEINTLISMSEESGRFAEIILSFLKNFKEKGLAYSDIEHKIGKIQDKYKKERFALFFKIFKMVYNEYENYLKRTNKIDFQDMIIKAAPLIRNSTSKYKLVMVDEFQDVSLGRASLVNAVLSVNPETKLFAVGDDYQAINGFAGSEIKYMYDFKKEFAVGKGLSTNMLTKTYRCCQGIIDVSSKFITKNEKQIKKAIITNNKDREHSFMVREYIDESDLFFKLESDLNNLDIGKNVAFLANRFHRKFMRDKEGAYHNNVSKIISLYKGQARSETIHYYKGLESDYVFLLMADKGIIPSEVTNDSILSLVASDSEDDFPFAEERRLFYVAITRAKRGVYIYCRAGNQSAFVKEIIKDFGSTDIVSS
ncbi:MAG: UvrD-helicase domain-containing protein [bacterium]